MLDFRQDFPDTTVVRLEENYRSTQIILDAANGVISENTQRLGKTLFTSRAGGTPIAVVAAADERDEAEWIAREFRDLAIEGAHGYSEMAVLYRTNAQSRALEDALRRSSVPYRVVGAVGFYARREVRDLLAYLRLVANPADDSAFLRAVQVPRRGIGAGSVRILQDTAVRWSRPLLETAGIASRVEALRPIAKRRLEEFARLFTDLRDEAKWATPAALLEGIIERIDYETYLRDEGHTGLDRIENVRELVAAAAEWSEEIREEEADGETSEGSTPVEQFLQAAALTTSDEVTSGDATGVTLMTVHTAKGLEWPVVVVAGLEDGLFPLSRALETPEGLEEERRLAYVALTRAQDRAYAAWARARRRGGQLMPGTPSRFLDAIPPGVVEERRTSSVFGGEWLRRERTSRSLWIDEVASGTGPDAIELESQDQPRYVKGERVHHRRFGSGTIRSVSGHGRALKVVVEFDDEETGSRHLLAAYAGLQRAMEGA
jgi:DNA helicase-2/ATP-dependent DNA helicase PcrA